MGKYVKYRVEQAKVSIIIPVYNTELYLEECLQSIVMQTLQSIEIICINDGSNDNSLSILERYAASDTRIRIISQENQGQSVARNKGLEIATAKYIYFMDSDDLLDMEALEYLYNEAEKFELDILYFDATVFYENQRLQEKYPSYITTYTYQRCEQLGEVYNGYDMMQEFHRIDSYRVSPCMQFLSHKFIDNFKIKFHERIVHEDQLFTLKSMLLATRVSHRKNMLFKRRIRDNSTMTQLVTVEHVRGCIVCYIQMYLFVKELGINQCYKKTVDKTMNNLRRSTLEKIEEALLGGVVLSEFELSLKEEYAFREIIYQDIVRLETEIKYNKKELKNIQKILKDTTLKYQRQEVLKNKKLEECEVELKQKTQELEKLKSSIFYRSYCLIKKISTKIYRGIKCYREHGFIYTFQLLRKKIGRIRKSS